MLDQRKLHGSQITQLPNKFGMWDGDQVLCVEHSRFQEPRGDCHFELRATSAGRVCDDSGKGTILKARRNAEHQARANLGHQS